MVEPPAQAKGDREHKPEQVAERELGELHRMGLAETGHPILNGHPPPSNPLYWLPTSATTAGRMASGSVRHAATT
jgi:hypothetical protein